MLRKMAWGFQNRHTKVDANAIDPEEETTPNPNTNRNDGNEKSSSSQQALSPNVNSNNSNMLLPVLNYSDTLYAEIRDQGVEKFGSFHSDSISILLLVE